MEEFVEMGARVGAARTRLDLADALAAAGRRDEAAQHVAEARTDVEALNAPRVATGPDARGAGTRQRRAARPIAIVRARADSAFGTRTVSTPASYVARASAPITARPRSTVRVSGPHERSRRR
jgi:hypothetical protein